MASSPSSTQNPILYDPDVQLMLRVRDADDAAAFEELMLLPETGAMARNMVGRRDLAEDLAQDVFLRVYRARKRYEPGAKFSTWLFTIANNAAFNALQPLSPPRSSHDPAGQFHRRDELGATGPSPQ